MPTTAKTPGTAVPPAYALCEMAGVEVFADGVYRGRAYTETECDELVANFAKFAELLTPTVVLGHEEDQSFLERTDLPAAGIVSRLYREGNKLLADFKDVPEPVGALIAAKAFRKVSIEHYDADRPFESPDGKQYGELILRRVALLGSEIPQVKVLADLPVPVFSYADREIRVFKQTTGGLCFAFSEVTPVPLKTADLKAPVLARLKASKFAKCFADAAVDRAQLEATLKGLFPGITDWSAFDDNQLVMLALGATAPAPAADKPADATAMADRPAMISDLVAAGEDAAKLEAMTDEELKALHDTLTGATPMSEKAKEEATKMSESVKASLANNTRLNAQLDAANKRTAERLKAAKEADVTAFCDRMVKEGRLLPAQRDKIERDLKAADDVSPTHKFAEGDRTVSVTDYERDRREIAAWPVVMKFGEKLPGATSKETDEARETAAVQRFAETQADALKAAGRTPAQHVHKFTELRKKDPTLTAQRYGVPAEYCA